MKIAIYYHINFSGAKRVVMEHAKGLKALGHTVDIYTTDAQKDIFDPSVFAHNKFFYEFSPVNINIPVVKRIKSDFIDTFISLKLLNKKIAKDVDAKNYDIVLVHTDIRTQAPYILRYLKTTSVYYCLEPLRNGYEYSLRLKNKSFILNKLYEDLNRWIRKRIDRKNALSANHTLTLSLFARERMIAAYDLYPKISYLGINEKTFVPKKLKKKKQILFVADKSTIYGYDLAVEALKLVPNKIRPELKIVSWKKNNAERISDKELVNMYNESILTLSLSRFDTFGLVPLESMACAVPVIALNVAGYRETILDGKTGYLSDFDPKDIAEKIITILENPKLAIEMGNSGRKWIENQWTWDKQTKQLEQLLINFVER